MPRGGKRPGAGRPRKGEAMPPRAKVTVTAPAEGEFIPAGEMPLDYLMRVMQDPGADDRRRDWAASVAAPYFHLKRSDAGKKGAAADAAEAASEGKFAGRPAPPKLVVNNR